MNALTLGFFLAIHYPISFGEWNSRLRIVGETAAATIHQSSSTSLFSLPQTYPPVLSR